VSASLDGAPLGARPVTAPLADDGGVHTLEVELG
jgi:hypothetical protein